ncbi:MAG: carboxypeptidase-like regulatory domain-containing protein [Bacteroidales bacterium]|jgi:hypothetical protein|nr:carboxypeptidase-like regulatory domain-containing protein [Bacteroidales bacterium]MDY0370345.1 carboxypeptidase-like regulatory domain-containing protein [Bacteroidales bacterium]
MRTVLKAFFLLLLLQFLASSFVRGQIQVSGKVTDKSNEPIPYINILVFEKDSTTIKAFAVTDEQGLFKLFVLVQTDSLDITASSIHFEKKNIRIANKSQTIYFQLEEDIKLLETITVRASPIHSSGDTLSYLVEQFAGRDDKSIEDVLKKMPGIEVGESGQISYKGLPINKFYVEGLDLMDGRYSVISRNLPQGAVSTVEVFEQHQPIRILQDRMHSHQAAINIKLKNKMALTGIAKTGSGLSPFLWNTSLTPMLMHSDFQILASYQTNNTGEDVHQQTQLLATDEHGSYPFRAADEIKLFQDSPESAYTAMHPKRFLHNNSHLGNFNILLPLKKDLQLRANIFFTDDKRSFNQQSATYYLMPDDTISFIEQIKKENKRRQWIGSIDINRNTKSNYLTNKTGFRFEERRINEVILLNTDSIHQQFHMPEQHFSNTLNSIFKAGDALVEFHSDLLYHRGPQYLNVVPGQFEPILNQSEPYQVIKQNSNIERMVANHFVGTNIGIKNWTMSMRIGFSMRFQELISSISKQLVEDIFVTDNLYDNTLQSTQYQLYLIPTASYKRKEFRLSISVPINHVNLKIEDKPLGKERRLDKVFTAPNISVYYPFHGFWDLRFSLRFNQRVGDPDEIAFNYLVNNYRSLVIMDVPIQQTDNVIGSATLSYRNAITTFFNTLSYHFYQRESNIRIERQIEPNGVTVSVAQNVPNRFSTHAFQFRSSKYISLIRSSFSLSGSLMVSKGEEKLNDDLFTNSIIQYSLAPEIFY